MIHANKKILAQMKEKRETFNHVSELTNRIKKAARELSGEADSTRVVIRPVDRAPDRHGDGDSVDGVE